jgi:cbb3-type cytochrome oxidase subunit 3
MKELLIKFISVPFVAYFAMMFTVAIMGSTIGNRALKELTGGSGLTIWLGWMAIFFITIIAHHFLKKKVDE